MNSQKSAFQLHPDVHYMNCAYKAPLLKSAEEAAIQMLIRERNPFEFKATDFFAEVEDVRRLYAKLIQAQPQQIVLLPSTTQGFATALNNISTNKGRQIILVEDEFPSGYFSAQRWASEQAAELKIISAGQEQKNVAENWNQKILEAINPQTAVVLISAIHWMNGLKFDLKAIGDRCKEVGAKFIVDGAQAVGAMPIDVQELGIHVLVNAAYKWLLGPYSVTLAYFDESFNDGKPLDEAWMNRLGAEQFSELTKYEQSYQSGAARYMVGQRSNFVAVARLKAALTQLLDWTPEAIQEYAARLGQPLFQYFEQIGMPLDSPGYQAKHLFSLPLPDGTNLEKLKQLLEEEQIYLSQRGAGLRVSLHLFNTKEDVEALLRAIDKAL